MSLTFFYGTDRDCLREHCFQLASQEHTVLIVPEQFSLSGETAFLSLQKYGTRVTTFRRFAREIFEQAGISGEYIPGSAKLILMEQALQQCTPQLTVYKNGTDKKGFADTMCKTVAELKHAEISPESLLAKGTELTEHPYLQEKLKDMALIYHRYSELTEKAGKDADDDLTRLTCLLSEQPDACELSDQRIVLFYFSGFTAQERRLISVLNRLCKEVHIGLVTEDWQKTASSKLCFYSTLRNIEAFLAFDPKFVAVEGKKRTDELSFLAEQYFSYPGIKWEEKPKQLQLFAAEHPYKEAEMVAAEIVRLCREEGMRYRDFAVVARNLSEYEDVLEQVFLKFDLPMFTDCKEQLISHPLVTFLLSIGDIFEYRWNYESVFHYAKSYFSPLTREEGDRLENFALAYGITGALWTDDQKWQERLDRAFCDEACGFVREDIENLRNQLVTPLEDLWEKVKGVHPYRNQATELFFFLESMDMYGKLTEKTDSFLADGEQRLSEEYRQIWNIFLHVLDQVVTLTGEEKGTFFKFMELMEEGFGASMVGSVPQSLDCVTVSSADRFVGEGVPCLFVMGINEGEFPASGQMSGLLDGTERDILEAVGLETATGRQKSAYMEQEIIYKVFSLARKKLILSYRKSDMDQTARVASQIVDRVRELFPLLDSNETMPKISTPGYTFSKMAERPQEYQKAKEWFETQGEWKQRLEMLNRKGDSQQVTLSPETVKKIYQNGLNVSVSRLERFQRCPFSFHATYHLRAKERRQYQLGAPDTGSFLHDILEQCSRLIDESASLSWQTITEEECTWLVERITEESLPKWFGGLLISSPRYFYLTARLKRLLSKKLYLISLHFKSGSFVPFGYELEFSEKGELPPVTLYTDDGQKVTMTGKVDRADIYRGADGSWIRIIDYKSGEKDLNLNDVYYGLNLQLVTYLDALCTDADPGGAFYFSVKDPYTRTEVNLDGSELTRELQKSFKMKGIVLAHNEVLLAMDRDCEGGSSLIPAKINKSNGKPSGNVIAEQDLILLRKQVKSCLRRLSSEIQKGRADVLPVKTKREYSCTYCPYLSVCGYEGKTGRCRSFLDLPYEEMIQRMEEENNE